MVNLQRSRSPNFGVWMIGHPCGRSCWNQLPLPVGLDGAVGRYRHHAGSRWRLRHWCSDVQCRVCWKIKWQGPWKEIQNTQKHKIQTCQVSSQHCPSSSAGSATSGTMMLGWKVRDRSNLSFYHGLRLMTVPMWCFLTLDNIGRHVIWYSKNKALCWFWFLLGVAMTVFGAFYECFCFKPVYKSVQAGQINWCKEWLVALISIVSSPVTCLVDLVLRKHLCMLGFVGLW